MAANDDDDDSGQGLGRWSKIPTKTAEPRGLEGVQDFDDGDAYSISGWATSGWSTSGWSTNIGPQWATMRTGERANKFALSRGPR